MKRLAFLDLILKTKHTNGEPLTNKEIRNEVNAFMAAVSAIGNLH